MCIRVLEMHITCKQIWTKMYVNRISRNACCSVYKLEIISLALKWIIVLRSAIKMRDHMHRILKNVFAMS